MNAIKIAEIIGFSKNHISKILQQLVKYGYLKSTRGPKGGFVVSQKAREASLFDIYRIMEGDNNEVQTCKITCAACPFKSCIFGDIERRYAEEFRQYLSAKKIVED